MYVSVCLSLLLSVCLCLCLCLCAFVCESTCACACACGCGCVGLQGFFGPRVPVDNLDAGVIGVSYFGNKKLVDPVIVSPDAGGVYRAKKFLEGYVLRGALVCGCAAVCVDTCLGVWVCGPAMLPPCERVCGRGSMNSKLPHPAGLAMIIKQRPRAGQARDPTRAAGR